MKVCPNCNQSYTDDSLNFCLNDGSTLTELKTDEPPPTILMNQARTTSPNFSDRQQQQQTNFTNQGNFGSSPISNWQNQSVAPNQPPSYMSPQMMAVQGQNQVLPTVSLILGVIGLITVCCWGGLPFGIAAVITGYLGMNNANNNPAQYGGRGLAIAGMACGAAGLLFGILVLIIAFVGNL
jgi:hypothetical protein